MTKHECAIVMAHTGICMLTGRDFQIFHKYVEDIMGRPIQTFEMGMGNIQDEIKEKSKADFIALCECASDESTETVTEFADRCRECGAKYGRRLRNLDKIRAEIQELRGCSCGCSDGIIDEVEDILDKYKAESEDKG